VDAGTSGQSIVNITTPASSPNATDPTTTGDDLDETITVGNSIADLVTKKTADNPAPVEGETFTYTLKVENHGPADATNVSLEDKLPEGLSWLRDDANGSYNPASGHWAIGDISNGDKKELHITVIVDKYAGGKVITNTTTAASTPDQEDNTTEGDDLNETVHVPEAPTITISDAKATEGDDLVFTITLSSKSVDPTAILLHTKGITAKLGSDYRAVSPTYIIIPAGETSALVHIKTIKDNIKEPIETMNLVGKFFDIHNSRPAVTGTGTIIDIAEDPAVESITDANVTEGQPLVHTVKMTIASASDEIYDFNIADDSTTAGVDYNTSYTFTNGVTYDSNGGTITVPAGVTEFTVTVQSIVDGVYEGSESYTITVDTKSATGTINDSDKPAVESITDANVTEDQNLSHTVKMTTASATAASYDFNITDVTTTAGDDYSTSYTFENNVTYDATTGKITVPAGVTEFNVIVKSIEDGRYEGSESYTIKVGTQTATGTIRDDVVPAVDSITDANVTEGENLIHTVKMTTASASDEPYDFSIEDNTTTRGADYNTSYTFDHNVTYDSNAGTITVPAGVREFNVTVKSKSDNEYEDSETYNIKVGSKTAVGTINDGGDKPAVESITDANVTEGQPLVHTVKMTTASATDASYDFNITDVTTTAGVDYNTSYTFTDGVSYDATTGKITVPAGVTEFTVTVESIHDSNYEPSESYTITVGTQTATGTIRDDVPPAVLRDDNGSGYYGDPITIDILKNDDNGTKLETISLIGPAGSTSTDEDGDGDIDKIVVPGEGTWTVDNTGKLTFTPEAGFQGNPTPITYEAYDENGYLLDPATVRLTYNEDDQP